jgi:hypothetical protein
MRPPFRTDAMVPDGLMAYTQSHTGTRSSLIAAMIAIGYSRLLYTHFSPLFSVRPVGSRPQDHKANDLEVILYSEYRTTKNTLKMCHSTKKNAYRVVSVSNRRNGFPSRVQDGPWSILCVQAMRWLGRASGNPHE